MLFVLKLTSPMTRDEFLDELIHQVFTRRDILETYASKRVCECKHINTIYFMAFQLVVGRFPEALQSEDAFREKADLLLTFCNPTEDHPPTTLFDECDFDSSLDKPADDADDDAWIDWRVKNGHFDPTLKSSMTCQAFVWTRRSRWPRPWLFPGSFLPLLTTCLIVEKATAT